MGEFTLSSLYCQAQPSQASASALAEFSLNLKLLHTPHPSPEKVLIQQEENTASAFDVDVAGLAGLAGLSGLVGLAGLADLAGLVGLAGLAGLAGIARQAGPELGTSQPHLVLCILCWKSD